MEKFSIDYLVFGRGNDFDREHKIIRQITSEDLKNIVSAIAGTGIR
jgi:hypothetical protein